MDRMFIRIYTKNGSMTIPLNLLATFLTVKRMFCELSSKIGDEYINDNDLNNTTIFNKVNLNEGVPLPGVNIEILRLILLWHESPAEFKRSVNWEQLFELVQTALYLQCDELINYILKVFVVPMLIDDDCSVRARLCSTYKQVAYDDNDWENDPRDEIDDFFLDIIPTEFIRKMFKKLSVDQMRLLMVAFHKNKSRFFPEFQKYIDAAEKYDIA